MKHTVRKLLSLFVILAMLVGIIPAAFAAGSDDIYWGDHYNSEVCWGRTDLSAIVAGTGEVYEHVAEYQYTDGRYDYYGCYYCDAEGYTQAGGSYADNSDHQHIYTYYDSVCHKVECYTDQNCEYWTAKFEPHYGTSCVCKGFSSEGLRLTQNSNKITYSLNDEAILSVTAAVLDANGVDVTSDYRFTFTWSIEGVVANTVSSGSFKSSARLDTSKDTVTATCVVKAFYNETEEYSATATWEGAVGTPVAVGATLYNTSTGYAFGSLDDEGSTSVETQIYNAVRTLNRDYTLQYVKFSDVEETGGKLNALTSGSYYYNYNLGNVVFTPTTAVATTVAFPFTAYCENDDNPLNDLKTLAGTVTFTVEEAPVGLGIVRTALIGEPVALDKTDFVKFWSERYPYGTLDSVTFSVPSNQGTLYNNYGTILGRPVTGACYYVPITNQIGLDNLTFVPKNGAVASVEISFTATGTKSYASGSGSSNIGTETGVITILYTPKEVAPIEYLIADDAVVLSADDFIAKYKEVLNVKTISSNALTVQFLDAPVYGALYLNYNSGNYYNSGVQLTSQNILNYAFSASKSAIRSIEDITYIAGAYKNTNESLRFACYYGGTLKFVGTVNFGMAQPFEVEYTTTNTLPVTFSAVDFADTSLAGSNLRFATPTYGALYRNYRTGNSAYVTAYDSFTVGTASYGNAYSVNALTYVPSSGYVGVVEIPVYSATSSLETRAKGTVKIYVGRSFTDVLSTSSAWAAPYINKLSAQGIVNGTDTGMTKYSPTKTVTYGEALKLIMMAAGYPEQAKTNTHWASGYLTKAYYDGLVNSSAIDLNAEVDRDTIASITAKALDLGYAASVNAGVTAPVDSSNGYVYALYNAGIVNGVDVGNYNYWYGSRSITRAEISKIICMVSDYAEAN